MEIRHLRSFCALAETLHFGMAADRLNIVQPALSTHIKQLEQHVGTRLVERSHHHVRLTAAGRDFLRHARDILHGIDRAIASARNVGSGAAGTLRIGAVSSALNLFLAHTIRAFEESCPGVEITLLTLDSCRQVAALAQGQLDLGFVRMPIARDNVEIRTIAYEDFDVVMARGHSLSGYARLTPEALSGQTILMLSRENAPGFHDALSRASHLQDLPSKKIKYFHEYTSAIQMAGVGLGVAIVPTCAVISTGDEIRRVPLDLGAHRSEIGAAWVDPLPPLAERLLSRLDMARIDTARMGGPDNRVRPCDGASGPGQNRACSEPKIWRGAPAKSCCVSPDME